MSRVEHESSHDNHAIRVAIRTIFNGMGKSEIHSTPITLLNVNKFLECKPTKQTFLHVVPFSVNGTPVPLSESSVQFTNHDNITFFGPWKLDQNLLNSITATE